MKPVAWIINGHLFEEYFKTSELDKIIPLYPSPRELSDVEIHYEVDKWERQNNYKHDADVHKTLIDFARAILKKASEK
jgi:hypothetical protein